MPPSASPSFSQQAAQLRNSHPIDAARLLRKGIQDPGSSLEDLESAWRLLNRAPEFLEDAKPVQVMLLGQCSLHGLAPAMKALAWASGVRLSLLEGGYDQVHQEVAALGAPPEAAILVPWSHRITSSLGEPGARVTAELAPWQMTWNRLTELGCGRLIQVGYDWVGPGPEGFHLGSRSGGTLDLIRAANARMVSSLPAGSYFLDLEALSGLMGRDTFYDPRQYHWTKRPFSQAGLGRLAREMWAGICCLASGPRKVLVLDLDNTLWGGVLGDLGVEGIALGESTEGEAFQAFQRHLKGLSNRGILLALASKNDEALVREAFQRHPNMVLRLEDFAAIEAHWNPKSESLRSISQKLNLHPDSFVFFDDNPAERDLIRQALPEVAVIEVPEDPCRYIGALAEGRWFETLEITEDDRLRTGQYVAESGRRELASSAHSIETFLSSLEMVGHVSPISETDLARVAQLLQKTNQFNLTTRRHSLEQLRALLALPGAIGLGLRMRDRFGDLGLVGVAIALPDAGRARLHVDTLLLSCRVIGRTAEHFLLNALLGWAHRQGAEILVGTYSPTPKNGVVASLWESLGFKRIDGEPGSDITYEGAVSRPPFATHVLEAT